MTWVINSSIPWVCISDYKLSVYSSLFKNLRWLLNDNWKLHTEFVYDTCGNTDLIAGTVLWKFIWGRCIWREAFNIIFIWLTRYAIVWAHEKIPCYIHNTIYKDFLWQFHDFLSLFWSFGNHFLKTEFPFDFI